MTLNTTPKSNNDEITSLLEYLVPLRRWWWLAVASTLVATLSMFGTTLMEPAQFQSRATVMVGAGVRDPNPNSGELYLAQQLVTTYVDLVQRASVRDPAMAQLGMTWLPAYSARQVPGTQLMELTVIDTDPLRAQAVAQALIDQLIAISPEGAQEQSRADFVEGELDALQASITETKAEIERRQGELANMFSARQIADAQTQISALQAKLSSLQTNFTSLLATTQKGAVNQLTVIEPPAPGTPVSNNLLYKLLTAAAIGFLLAAGGAYLIEFLDKSLKNSDEVQRELGLATLGAIPDTAPPARPTVPGFNRPSKKGARTANAPAPRPSPLAPAELVMLDLNHTAAAEAYRVLRTNLQFAAVAHPVRALVITSPLPSEGKSVVSANLAIAVAQAGFRVALLDCDLHRPRQHRIFGLGNGLGVSTALLGIEGVSLDDFLQQGPLPSLRVMTSGPLPPNPAEVLGSARMRTILDEVGRITDFVVIDSPPASVLADAAVLSRQADGVLLVLHAGRTSHDVARRTVAALQQVQAHVLGVVLNRMPVRGSGYYYYHSYNYTYAKQYYRRDDSLVGGAIPVTPPRPATNGKSAPAGEPARTPSDPSPR
ncbi:MAG: polysaccharide biosynthesis tyrosine autokinase [Caldilinea sp.]|nr:polysaccharide biosynthesis tyrosine autokinase [Caldilinea sp.]